MDYEFVVESHTKKTDIEEIKKLINDKVVQLIIYLEKKNQSY